MSFPFTLKVCFIAVDSPPPPQVSGLVQASTIMDLHSSLSSASWINLLLGIRFLVAKAFRLLIYVVLCLPLLLFPSIFPQSTVFSSPFFLLMWPTNFSCLFLIVVISERFVSASCNTSSLVFLSVHDILISLLKNHISVASSFFSMLLEIVQHSHPYNRTDHMYVFRVLIFVCMEMFLINVKSNVTVRSPVTQWINTRTM